MAAPIYHQRSPDRTNARGNVGPTAPHTPAGPRSMTRLGISLGAVGAACPAAGVSRESPGVGVGALQLAAMRSGREPSAVYRGHFGHSIEPARCIAWRATGAHAREGAPRPSPATVRMASTHDRCEPIARCRPVPATQLRGPGLRDAFRHQRPSRRSRWVERAAGPIRSPDIFPVICPPGSGTFESRRNDVWYIAESELQLWARALPMSLRLPALAALS